VRCVCRQLWHGVSAGEKSHYSTWITASESSLRQRALIAADVFCGFEVIQYHFLVFPVVCEVETFLVWCKALVPLHATQALGGRGGIAPTHSWPRHRVEVSGQRHAPAALCPGERTPGTHCTGGWLGLRASWDTEVRGKPLCPCRGSNPDLPVAQSVVRHYTD
jgi:hypothetical protein